jgi:hypothetical protein
MIALELEQLGLERCRQLLFPKRFEGRPMSSFEQQLELGQLERCMIELELGQLELERCRQWWSLIRFVEQLMSSFEQQLELGQLERCRIALELEQLGLERCMLHELELGQLVLGRYKQ